MAEHLPTFEDIRARAFALLGDAEDELRSDWQPGTGPQRNKAAQPVKPSKPSRLRPPSTALPADRDGVKDTQ